MPRLDDKFGKLECLGCKSSGNTSRARTECLVAQLVTTWWIVELRCRLSLLAFTCQRFSLTRGSGTVSCQERYEKMVGASGFEPPTSWSRTRRSSQAEPRPEINCAGTRRVTAAPMSITVRGLLLLFRLDGLQFEGQRYAVAGVVRTPLLHRRLKIAVLRGQLIIGAHRKFAKYELAVVLGREV